MRKFFIFLFKFIIPFAIVLYPIIKSLQWSISGYLGAGVAFVIFIILWFKLIKKITSDIVFKENHERLIDKAIHFNTNLKYELLQFAKFVLTAGILFITYNYFNGIFKYLIYIFASYFIGAVIKIGGSIEFKKEEW